MYVYACMLLYPQITKILKDWVTENQETWQLKSKYKTPSKVTDYYF